MAEDAKPKKRGTHFPELPELPKLPDPAAPLRKLKSGIEEISAAGQSLQVGIAELQGAVEKTKTVVSTLVSKKLPHKL